MNVSTEFQSDSKSGRSSSSSIPNQTPSPADTATSGEVLSPAETVTFNVRTTSLPPQSARIVLTAPPNPTLSISVRTRRRDGINSEGKKQYHQKQPPISLNVVEVTKKKVRRGRVTITVNGTERRLDFGKKHDSQADDFITQFSWYKFSSTVTSLHTGIKIELIGCTGLALTDMSTTLSGNQIPAKPDPYIILRSSCLDDDTVFHKTKHVQNSCNPIFTSATKSTVTLKKEDVLRVKQGGGLIVEVFDFDRVGKDDLLGTAFVPFGLLLFDKDRVEFPLETNFPTLYENAPPPMVMLGFAKDYNNLEEPRQPPIPDCRSPMRAVSLETNWFKTNSSSISGDDDIADFMSADGSGNSAKSPKLFSRVRKNIVKTTKVSATAITPTSTRRLNKTKNQVELRVKPYADAFKDQRWMTKSDLHKSAFEPSDRYTPVKPIPPSCGRLFVEALYANDLPNRDGGRVGKLLGKLTDAFCCFVFNDSFATTCVIDNCLAPIWPPWENRGFVFPLYSSSRILHVGVFDSDAGDLLGGFDYDKVGRSYISLVKLREGVEYTLELKLNNSSTYVTAEDRAKKDLGTLCVRVRVDWGEPGPRGAMLYDTVRISRNYWNGTLGLDDSERSLHVRDARDYQMVRYCVEGSRIGSNYNLKTVYAMVDEVQSFAIVLPLLFIAARTLILWQEPAHSLVTLCVTYAAVSNPNLIPSAIIFLTAYALFVINGHRSKSANPFKRPRTHFQLLTMLLLNRDDDSNNIDLGEGANTDSINEKERQRAISDVWRGWQNFVDKKIRENAEYNEMLAAMEVDMHDPSNGPTVKLKGVLGSVVDPVSAVLSPIQTALHPVLCYVRLFKNVVLGNEPNLNFLLTLTLLLSSLLLAFIPFGLIFRTCGKIVVLAVLGPQNILLNTLLNRGAGSNFVPPILFASKSSDVDDDELIETGVLPPKQKPAEEANRENKNAIRQLRVQQEKILKVRDEKIKKEGRIILKKFALNVERFAEVPVSEGSASEKI